MLADAALKLQAAGAGAECIVLCTNTMHKVAAAIEAAVAIPLLHIADATAEAIQQAGLNKVALLGTRFTMEQDFYKKRLTESYGLEVLVPDEEGRNLVHQVIYQELCLGIVKPESRQQYQQIMADLVTQGAEAIILGCTEIGLLVSSEDCAVPLFDTTALHAQKAADYSLQ
ncbi:aspartate/glutamate racemase family protein [Rheinheimera soli]|uniref:aspartate/glutamate racemase family protein n=1 Tax=Rheinheimera soli TaxID=443616 RepID=UPI0022B886CA|nr:amino acid racemase [Rheinheimera soli]